MRLPIHSSLYDVEQQYMPEFNFFLKRLADSTDVPYLVISPDDKEWSFTDGNHMTPASGAKVSRLIGEELLKELPRSGRSGAAQAKEGS